MAVAKPRRGKGSNAPVVAQKNDPLDWLYTNPGGASETGLTFGVLRKEYGGRKNSALEFGWRKCHVGRQPSDADFTAWTPNVERVEVILPAKADDMLADPAVLLQQMDVTAAECEKALLVYITLPLGDVERVHVGWERARAFARRLACERDLASVLALHAPGRVNTPFALHAHCLVVPRCIAGLGIGHGLYDSDLTHDAGQALIEALWSSHLAGEGPSPGD